MNIKSPNKNIYILIGGGCHTGHTKNKLATEIENWLTFKQIETARVLFIPFAKDEIDWERTVQKYQNSIFSKVFKKNRLSVSTAIPNPKTLKTQLCNADILFFSGGSELNLKKLFKKNTIPSTNKIIIGVSAGTNFLSKFYFSNDREKVEAGLGILPIKTICHFSTEKNKRAILLSVGKKYPVFPIGNDEYITIIF
jgi:peptidase E